MTNPGYPGLPSFSGFTVVRCIGHANNGMVSTVEMYKCNQCHVLLGQEQSACSMHLQWHINLNNSMTMVPTLQSRATSTEAALRATQNDVEKLSKQAAATAATVRRGPAVKDRGQGRKLTQEELELISWCKTELQMTPDHTERLFIKKHTNCSDCGKRLQRNQTHHTCTRGRHMQVCICCKQPLADAVVAFSHWLIYGEALDMHGHMECLRDMVNNHGIVQVSQSEARSLQNDMRIIRERAMNDEQAQ